MFELNGVGSEQQSEPWLQVESGNSRASVTLLFQYVPSSALLPSVDGSCNESPRPRTFMDIWVPSRGRDPLQAMRVPGYPKPFKASIHAPPLSIHDSINRCLHLWARPPLSFGAVPCECHHSMLGNTVRCLVSTCIFISTDASTLSNMMRAASLSPGGKPQVVVHPLLCCSASAFPTTYLATSNTTRPTNPSN